MKEVFDWLEALTVSATCCNGRFKVSTVYVNDHEVMFLEGLAALGDMLGLDVIREDWHGNAHCGTNYDEISFMYNGVKFRQLIDKDEVYLNVKSISN